MSDVVESAKRGLSGKVGPVPVWAIAAGLGLVSVGGYYVYAKRSQAAVSTDPVATDMSGTVDKTYSTAGYNTASDSGASSDSGTSTTSSAPSSNAAWIAVASVAAANANTSALTASVALTKYVTGASLTGEQREIVNRAISLKGFPPDGVDALSGDADAEARETARAQQAAADEAQRQRDADAAAAQAQRDSDTRIAAAQQAQAEAEARAAAASAAAEAAAAAPQVTAVNTAPKPAAVVLTNSTRPIGSTFTIASVHRAYSSWANAVAKKNVVGTVTPGSYVLTNRTTQNGQLYIKVRPAKGGNEVWIEA